MNYPSIIILTSGVSEWANTVINQLNKDDQWGGSSARFWQEDINSESSLTTWLERTLSQADLVLVDWPKLSQLTITDFMDLLRTHKTRSWIPIFSDFNYTRYHETSLNGAAGYLLYDYSFDEITVNLLKIHTFNTKQHPDDPISHATRLDLDRLLRDVSVCPAYFSYFNGNHFEVFTAEALKIMDRVPLSFREETVRYALSRAHEESRQRERFATVGVEHLQKRWKNMDYESTPVRKELITLNEINDLLSDHKLTPDKLDKELSQRGIWNWRQKVMACINAINDGTRNPISINEFTGIRNKMLIYIFILNHPSQQPKQNELDIRMAVLKRTRPVQVLSAHKLFPGDDLNTEVNFYIQKSRILISLICHELLADDNLYKYLEKLVQRDKAKLARFITVITGPCDWLNEPILHTYQDTPYQSLQNPEHFEQVVTSLYQHVDQLLYA